MLRERTADGLFTLTTSPDSLVEAAARLRDLKPAADSSLINNLIATVHDYMDDIIEDYPEGPVSHIKDDGDWHIHHAAVASGADILLSDDQGFASDQTSYEAFTCDQFFVEISRSASAPFRSVTLDQASYWAKRGGKQLPDALVDAGCPAFADYVRQTLRRLA